ncbi:MAG: hypothetical protein A2381_01450 [Bdellovibrionales bacterium RIFOXYB1_FULL_37_110]|nr:MAG: hypothetical protein A2417_02305 [Bdellovibrionales bacterium RIFOXYC1_FULL_37_79]OFZ58882.1 MAG: hypothetical protein A2381_01450 [Bdellovibrionales bacterium RIFOXYB1_FULL_37_110]OFZ64672.1 MAG: hypothetical protein A2577_13485 [Bdellovibrionales bacterium RIFOXYD1_FULL_36_51]
MKKLTLVLIAAAFLMSSLSFAATGPNTLLRWQNLMMSPYVQTQVDRYQEFGLTLDSVKLSIPQILDGSTTFDIGFAFEGQYDVCVLVVSVGSIDNDTEIIPRDQSVTCIR